ncbi:MAG: GtrA family protein [Candidatus Heimdallarchaeaceae archaeon]
MESSEEGFFSSQRGKRFAKFFIIGTIGYGLNFLLLYLFNLLLGITIVKDVDVSLWIFTINQGVIASLLSMVIVFVFTFVTNKLWTFRGQGSEFQPNTLFQFFQFTLIGLVGYAIYTGIMMILHGSLLWNEYLAMTIAFYAGLISNFIWNDIWTFNPKLIEKRKQKKNKEEHAQVEELQV